MTSSNAFHKNSNAFRIRFIISNIYLIRKTAKFFNICLYYFLSCHLILQSFSQPSQPN